MLHALALLTAAATLVPLSVEQLADKSTHVVRARVVSHSSAREEGPAGIYTRTIISVNEQLQGASPQRITVRQAGGTIGTESVELPGDAQLVNGEEVLLFLACKPGRDYCNLVGLSEGKFHLEAQGTDFAASRDFHNVAFVGPPLQPGPESYAALAARVRAHARNAK